jgi:thiol:disulfide interchange protein
MKPRFALPLCLAYIAAATLGPLQPSPSAAEPVTKPPLVSPVYVVDKYDPKRRPEDDLKAALKRAAAENKRILVQAGGDWCGWCKLLDKYFRENDRVAAALAADFLIIKVNYSDENRNEEFFKQFPPAEGYPQLYVVDASGKLLRSQGTGELEEGRGYNEDKVLRFLRQWAPPAPVKK